MKLGSFIREFSEDSYGRMVDLLNTGLSFISLDDNMDGEAVSVTLPSSGIEVKVPHNLKVVPKYRIIVKKSGDGIVSDGDSEWTERYIYLKASQVIGVDLNITIFIMRG